MKQFKIFYQLFAAAVLALAVSGCESFELDINTDPNNPTSASPELLLANAQYEMANNLAETTNSQVHAFIGQVSFFDRFDVTNSTYNLFWTNMYSGPLKDIEELIKASDNSPHYQGIGQVLKAYMFTTMVDLFGDVPFSEAFKGDAEEKIVMPKFDKDSDIYAACFQLIEEALANFAKGSPVPVAGDLIYGGNINRWKAFAKSLKLKMKIQTRLVNPNAQAEIDAIIVEGGLMSTAADDFQFRFSKTIEPDKRHPWYKDTYTGGEFYGTYVLHQQMVEMLLDDDPRWPFYFRRQTTDILDPNDPTDKNTMPCNNIACVYGYVVLNNPFGVKDSLLARGWSDEDATSFLAGVFGRDRGDPSGIPADGSLRTLPGVYPAGGFYDVATPALPAPNAAPGGGILPMVTHVNVLYYQIEAILKLGVSGDARALFEQAIRKHIDKVANFGVAADANAVKPDQSKIDAYVNRWLARFDAAGSEDAKLNIVLKQLWFSSWGNGYEIWNAMRRTGLPTTIQEHVATPARGTPYRLPYSQTELTINTNASAYQSIIFDQTPIFWDAN